VEERGFSRTEDREAVQRQDLSGPIPDPLPPAEGYMLRETSDDPDDHARMADLLNAGFGRDIHSAAEYASFTAVSPSFRHDLNLVAVGPDGTFAAHAGFTYDEANRFGILEPVCTRPDHRRRGLALSLIREGIRRVRRLGAVAVTVDTGADEGPNRLYEAAGFVRARWGHVWHRAEGGG
jgi:predicted N-acetyltransferase YhbS